MEKSKEERSREALVRDIENLTQRVEILEGFCVDANGMTILERAVLEAECEKRYREAT